MTIDPGAAVAIEPTETDFTWIADKNELGHQDPRSVKSILSDPDNKCFIEPTTQTVALFGISHELQQVQIAWLLPRDAPINELKVPFKAGFFALADNKKIQDYEFVGDVKMELDDQGVDVGERVVLTWQVEWKRGGAEMTVEPWAYDGGKPDHWRVRCKPFSACIAVANTWEV